MHASVYYYYHHHIWNTYIYTTYKQTKVTFLLAWNHAHDILENTHMHFQLQYLFDLRFSLYYPARNL